MNAREGIPKMIHGSSKEEIPPSGGVKRERALPVSFTADIAAYEKHYTQGKLFPDRFKAIESLAEFIAVHERAERMGEEDQSARITKRERSERLQMLANIGRKSSAFIDMVEAEHPWVSEVIEWALKHTKI